MKRKLMLSLLLLAVTVLPADAACTTHTYFVDGRIIICTTCCYGLDNCTTTCT